MDREINVVVEKLSRLRELRAVVSTNNTSCLRAWGLCEHSRTSRRMPTPFLSIGVWNFSFFFSSRRRRALRQERAVKSSANNASSCQSINCFVFLFSFFFSPLFFFFFYHSFFFFSSRFVFFPVACRNSGNVVVVRGGAD